MTDEAIDLPNARPSQRQGSRVLKSPAKINLYLKVLRRRPDGFHDIETVFERIDLCDEIKLTSIEDGIRVLCDNPKVPTDERNLVYKAAQALRQRYELRQGVEIAITKRIPVAAGLGGASSNCAVCLRGLNDLWGLGLDNLELLEIGKQLGSDVAFFLMDAGRAVGRGRGELLEELPEGESFWYLLVNPGVEVLAKEAYSALNLDLTPRCNNSKINALSFREMSFEGLKELLFNSLEGPIAKRVREIGRIKSEMLKVGLKGALMSGSGPTVFGIAAKREEALEAERKFSLREGWQAFVAKTYW